MKEKGIKETGFVAEICFTVNIYVPYGQMTDLPLFFFVSLVVCPLKLLYIFYKYFVFFVVA